MKKKRWTRIQHVQSLFKEGYSKAAIQRKLHHSSGTVYAGLQKKEKPNHQQTSAFKRFHSLIRSLVQEEQTVKQIEVACRAEGYRGSLGTLNNLVAEKKKRQTR